MSFGIKAPWYDGDIERTAFNLYAMDCQHKMEIEDAIQKVINGDTHIDFSFDLSDAEMEYIENKLAAAGYGDRISFT